MSKQDEKKIVIKGVTQQGKFFRPSDWAERVSGVLASFKDCRIYYSPLLQPSVQDGYKCIILDPILKKTCPPIYQAILHFAKENQLKICNEDTD
jgi:hypothetical protein